MICSGRSGIAIVWSELPAYAARQIAAYPADFPIIATRPRVPIEGMDAILPGRIYWINENFRGGFSALGLSVPKLLIVPSWSSRYSERFEIEVRSAGGYVVVAFDNVWKGSLRQWLGVLRFRTTWRRRFAAAWVVGLGGRSLASAFGFLQSDIHQGLYGTDPVLFNPTTCSPLPDRMKRIVFIGRLVPEKGVLELISAWRNFQSRHPDWSLHIFGSGPLADEVRAAPVEFHGFQQPERIAAAMAEARFLVLPSHDEHWGLVVCEAAQAGCGLLLSDAVGSAPDLLGPSNGKSFAARDPVDLARALDWAAARTPEELVRIEEASRKAGLRFTPQRWADTLHALRMRFLGSRISS